GGQSLPGFPTRYSFKKAGYGAVARTAQAKLASYDEAGFASAARAGKAGGSATSSAASSLPIASAWDAAQFRVSLPRLTRSTALPFSGALRNLFSLLPQDTQAVEQVRMPETIRGLAATVRPNLV